MSNNVMKSNGGHESPLERIRQTNARGMEYWDSRDPATALDYTVPVPLCLLPDSTECRPVQGCRRFGADVFGVYPGR